MIKGLASLIDKPRYFHFTANFGETPSLPRPRTRTPQTFRQGHQIGMGLLEALAAFTLATFLPDPFPGRPELFHEPGFLKLDDRPPTIRRKATFSSSSSLVGSSPFEVSTFTPQLINLTTPTSSTKRSRARRLASSTISTETPCPQSDQGLD